MFACREPHSVAGVLAGRWARERASGCRKSLPDKGSGCVAAVEALSGGGCDDVVVVLGAAVVDVPAPARAVVAADWAVGA